MRVLATFGAEPLHHCRAIGLWDVEMALNEMPEALERSSRTHNPRQKTEKFREFFLRLGERTFLTGTTTRVHGYASTEEEALRIVKGFTEKYAQPDPPSGGSFELIKNEEAMGICCENVPLNAESVLNDDVFALHYPEGTNEWHLKIEAKLTERTRGLMILEGEPGTGKTSYLRHLMGRLRESHRFYFIPPSSMSVLSNPKFIGFWADERKLNTDKKLAVILEDADAALMTRGSDNREQVSAILNLTDGMLGDFLSLQIICTINCRITDIDQALQRPGRLISHRRFERLDAKQAGLLASHLGKALPMQSDYSLAEVFSGEEQETPTLRRMGFGG